MLITTVAMETTWWMHAVCGMNAKLQYPASGLIQDSRRQRAALLSEL